MKSTRRQLWCVVTLWCGLTAHALAAEKDVEVEYGGDVVIQWHPYWLLGDSSKPVKFWLNGRRISDGEQGMQEILTHVHQMPRGRSVVWGPNNDWFIDGPGGPSTAPGAFPDRWKELNDAVNERGLTSTWFGHSFTHLISLNSLTRPQQPEASATNGDAQATRSLVCDWRNFPTRDTAHEEVVYLVDGRFVGMGDAGFDELLNRVRELPVGAALVYPRYITSRKFFDREHWEALEKDDPVPFAARRAELARAIDDRRLTVERSTKFVWLNEKTLDFELSDDYPPYFATLFRFATIVRDGREPAAPTISISWEWEHSRQKTEIFGTSTRDLTSSAIYRINGEAVGAGTKGFLAAIARIEKCVPGDVIRIDPVCIRTTGPFRCVLLVPGQRHFETTGVEPFRGLVDILADVVERKKLRVELIPDEGKSNCSCHPK